MLVIISAVTTNAPDNHADNDDSDQENRAAPAHPFYEQRQAGSEQVAQRGDYDRPEDGARNVVSEENTPRHLARSAGQQGRKDAQAGDKPRDQNRFVAVGCEVILHVLESLRSKKEKAANAKQKPAAIMMSDGEADIVAGDRAGGRNQHHQRETEYSRRAEIAGDEENGFTGHGQPGIFEHHAKEDCPITVCEHVLLDQLQGIMEKIHRATLQESLWRY